MKNLTEINLEKSRSGVYKDTAENRRLHRVGQRYGEPKKEEEISSESKKPTKVKIEGKTFRVEDGKIVASMLDNQSRIRKIMKFAAENGYKVQWEESKTVQKPEQQEGKGEAQKQIAEIRAMGDEEFLSKYFGQSRDAHNKAVKEYDDEKKKFTSKWGGEIDGIIGSITSKADIDELLKDSKALGEKQSKMYDTSLFDKETITKLRTSVVNAIKRGKKPTDINPRYGVSSERYYWGEGEDKLARYGETIAEALKQDLKTFDRNKIGGELGYTVNAFEYHLDKKRRLTDEQYKKLKAVIRSDFDSGEKGNFARVNMADIPNAHKVNLKKYLSAKRKAAVDEAWSKAGVDEGSSKLLQESYNKLRDTFNNNFDSMSKSERAEHLYRILKVKNAMEKGSKGGSAATPAFYTGETIQGSLSTPVVFTRKLKEALNSVGGDEIVVPQHKIESSIKDIRSALSDSWVVSDNMSAEGKYENGGKFFLFKRK